MGKKGELEYLPGAIAALVYHSNHYQVLFLKKRSPVQAGSGGKVKKKGISLLSLEQAKSGIAPRTAVQAGSAGKLKKKGTSLLSLKQAKSPGPEQAKSEIAPRTVSPGLELSSHHSFPGIANVGNTCYLGASLQLIFPMRHFLEDLSKLYLQKEDKTELKLTEATLQLAIACGALSPKEELASLDGPSISKLLDVMNQITKDNFPW